MSRIVYKVDKAAVKVTLPNRQRKVFAPGEVFPDDLLPPDEMRSLIKQGTIREVNRTPEQAAQEFVLRNQKSSDNDQDPTQQIVPKIVTQEAPVRARGKWDFDPAKLQGMNLTQLNSLIFEHDGSAVPLASEEAAIKHLSQDFTG